LPVLKPKLFFNLTRPPLSRGEPPRNDHQTAERIPASRSIPHIWPLLMPPMLKWKVISHVTYLTLHIHRIVYTASHVAFQIMEPALDVGLPKKR